jgi:hypothetical protein
MTGNKGVVQLNVFQLASLGDLSILPSMRVVHSVHREVLEITVPANGNSMLGRILVTLKGDECRSTSEAFLALRVYQWMVLYSQKRRLTIESVGACNFISVF